MEDNNMAIAEKKVDPEFRYRITPEIDYEIDYDNKAVDLDIELPGVDKKDIELKILPGEVHVKAVRGNIEYHGDVEFGFDVIPEKTTAKYTNGLLQVRALIKDAMEEARTVEI